MKNPYLKRSRIVSKYLDIRTHCSEKTLKAHKLRKKLRKRYSYAIPNNEAISTLCALSPIVEIGAGNGYWAYLIEQNGGDVVCYDKSPDVRENYYSDRSSSFHKIKEGDHNSVKNHPHRTLFLSWSDDFNQKTGWSDKTLRNYINSGGDKIACITEGKGGAAGSDKFFKILRTKTQRIDLIEIPTFPNLHDFLEIRELIE